jgi:hypothetical protein
VARARPPESREPKLFPGWQDELVPALQELVITGSEYGAGMGHNTRTMPFVMAGNGGGKVKSGRHLKFDHEPLGRFVNSVGQVYGVNIGVVGAPQYGTEPLPGLPG